MKELVLSAQRLVLSAKKVLVTVALCAVGLSASAAGEMREYEFAESTIAKTSGIKDPADFIDWGTASMAYGDMSAKHGKFLEASADAMIAAYGARIAKDPTDYEAHICRAFAYMKKAGENRTFFDLAKDFGYVFNNDTMHFTGELVHEKGVTPEMNDASDQVCDILLPLMKSAYADLVTIPHNWKGCVAITPDVYPVDEAVYFDYADTLMAKAALAEMMCILNMVKGFDVTLDSDLLEYTFDAKIPSLAKRGVQAILDNNPEFFSKVRDQKALTEAGDWWASAATLLDQWDKAHAKRSDGKPHFFDWNFEKLDSNGAYGVNWLRTQSQELANLPYWASPIDFTKINGDDHQFLSFKPIFGGKFLRQNLPEFGVGVKEPYCNEPLIDTCPDSTLCGIFVSSSPTYLASYISTRWTDIPPYTDNRTAPVYGIWYKNLFTEGGIGFENEGNPLWFAWDNANPIKLLDPEFNVRGVTAVFKGWSGVIHDGNTPITFEESEIPTPIAQPMKYKDRRVELTANFEIPKVTYLDFDGTSGKLAERTDECELVTENTTTLTTGKVYAVVGDVSLANCVKVLSTPESPAKLVLCDEATLWATNGIEVADGNALIICGQALGTGMLEATGSSGTAGIGGGGIVTINGGTVMATGGSSGSGIGGGTVTINAGTVTAAGRDGAAGIGGTVKFCAGTAYGVAAGDDEASALYMTAEAYAADHSAAYVALPCFSLKIPDAGPHYTYEVSYLGMERTGWLADGTNMYAVASGATVKVHFTLEEDYAFDGPFDNPMIIANLSDATVIDAGDLPTVKFAKKGSEENPWTIGTGVTAYTNGTELVIVGAGKIGGVSEIPAGIKDVIEAITITTSDVTGAVSDAFAGFDDIALTLPVGWQGDRPDAGCNWYGATGVAIAGSKDAPWVIGDGVTAYTNGTELVISGTGTITDLSKIPDDIKSGIDGITITTSDVTGAASDAFAGFDGIALTLPEGWSGDRPDAGGNWYGATGTAIAGSEDCPWTIGTDGETPPQNVTAYTNGTELVIGGAGTISDLSKISDDVKSGIDAITITTSDVTGAAEDAFAGIGGEGDVAVTLPDGWQGELPDESGNWYGARNVSLTAYPLAVKNVQTATHWPWDGKIDITCDLTGSGEVDLSVALTTNGVTVYKATTLVGETTIDLVEGTVTNGVKLVWSAQTDIADANFNASDVRVAVTVTRAAEPIAVQLWEGGPYWAKCNVGATKPEECGYYFWWGDTVGYTNKGSAWISVLDSTKIRFYSSQTPANGTYNKDEATLKSGNWIDDKGNLTATHDAAAKYLDSPWRMPTDAEMQGLTDDSKVSLEWTTENGVYGCLVTGVTAGYTGRSVFLPAAGYGFGDDFRSSGEYGYYWSATPKLDTDGSNYYAWSIAFNSDGSSRNNTIRSNGLAVRPVRDTALSAPDGGDGFAAVSEAFAFDLRTEVALAEGEVVIPCVAYSDTAWDEVEQASVTLGYTNLTTGAIGVLESGLCGEGAKDVALPKKNGDYRLTHSTGGLTSFMTFVVSGYPIGCESNPWKVGPADDPESIVAWTDGNGNVYFKPARSAASREGLDAVTNVMGGASFPAKLISEDGSETNDLVMVLGASGTPYDTIADALAEDETGYTLFDVNGYLVSYNGGEGASGTMATDKFIPTVPTNLTANAYTIVGYAFAGWSTDGVNKAYDDCAAGVDFVQPGETLSLTALWERVAAVPASYDDLTNMLANATRPVTITLDEDIEIPVGGKIVVPAGKDVTFAGIGKFDVTAERPALFCGYPVGTGLKPEDLDRFVTDEDVRAYFEDGKVVVRGRGETEDFPWLLGTEGHEDEVTAWAGDGMILAKPARGTASVAAFQSVTNALSGYVPGLGELKVITADGTATNDVVALVGDDGMSYDTLADVFAADPMPTKVRLYEVPGQTISLPTGVAGQTLVVSNLTAGTVITPSSTLPGGAEYVLPFGAKIAIYVVPSDGYRLLDDGTNPIVIDEVTTETTVDVSEIPTVKSLAEESAIGDSDVTWKIEDGVLVIEGSGDMPDFDEANPAPWNEFSDKITAVSVGEGVEHLGDAAFFACPGATSITLANEEGVVNLAAFVSADGSETSFPENVFIVEDGEKTKAVRFEGDADEDYDSLDAAYAAGETDVAPLTLNNIKADYVEGLEEIAGPAPRSEEMQKLFDEAVEAILAATTPEELDEVAEEQGEKISVQAEKESPKKIGDSDVTWRIVDGTLVIEGEGDMPDFDEANPAPWNEFADEITSVEIGEEVTHLGDAAFAVCPTNGEASVLFKDPEIDMNLGAFVSGDGSATNVPTVKVQVVTGDGRTLRVAPGGWTDVDDPNVIYGSLAEAIENGVRAVTPAFEKKTDTGDVVIPPAEVEEIVIVTDGTGAKTELAAKFVNDANGLGLDREVGLVTEVENIAASVEALSSNIVVTVKLESSGTMDVALSNECELVKAGFAPDAATLGFVSHNFDIDVAWSYAGAGGELTELPASIVVHVPMKVYDGLVYSVSRLHGGAFEALPEWTAGTADSTTAEWFKVDVANGEIVIKTRLFCPYAIGVLELEKTCSVSVGNGDKYVGDRDPVSLPTNFTLTVTGPYNLSEFAGYAKRAYGESAGDYAINFVCVKMPDGFPAAGFGVKPGVFTIAERPDRIEPTGKVTYAKATKGNILYPSKPATWSAKPGLGSRFAGWEWIGEGAEPAGFHKLYENERRLTTLKFTVGKKERIAPKDFAAKWVRIDEDLLTDVWLSATNRLTTDSRSYVSMTIKGVPAGLKFVAKRLAFGGTAKKNGRFKVTVSAKNSSGYTLKQTGYLVVAGKKVVGYEPITTKLTGVPLMLWCDTTKGSVSGCGVFASGSTRKVNAKAKTGYVFAGWFSDPGFSTPAKFKGGKDHRIASQALVLKKPNYLFARFLPKTTTADPIVWLRYEGAGYCGAPASFLDEKETWYQGVRLPTNGCQIAFGSASLPAVSVKGLPAGVTFDKKTLRFKGSPTRAGTFTVKVTVKNQSASTDVLTRKVVVKALPKWLVGTFDGISLGLDGEGALVENGITTVTVGSTGKISGKTVVKGKASAFKTTSFTSVMLDGDDLVYVLGTRTFAQSAETGLGEYVYIVNGLERAWAVQRGWTRKDLALALPVFPTGTKALKLSETAEDGSVIKFTFGAYGVIKVAGKVPGKGGKLVSISGSCRVLPTGMNTVQDAPEKPERLAELLADTCVNIAPTKTLPAGFCAVEPLAFTVNSSNKVTAVADPSAD